MGSARNFRRLVARAKRAWRAGNHRGRRPGVWAPGEVLVIDWGTEAGLHIFCAVMAFSRWRFVRFATDEKAATTLEMLARCFEALGGVPKVVLADRMGCLKGGVVANVVVPTPAYVRFASSLWFPARTFVRATTPNRRGSWRTWSATPSPTWSCPRTWPAPTSGTANEAARAWCDEVNGQAPLGDIRRAGRAPGGRAAPPGPAAVAAPGFARSAVTRKVDRLAVCALAVPAIRCRPS